MTYNGETLLRLLPELYETEDDGPLRALFEVLAGEAERMDENIRQLYDDLFIETCDEWVVPYIGELLGVRALRTVEGAPFSQRGWVANAIASRRRKGTASMLRQLAQDVTGYRAVAVEMFALAAWTQYANHLRPQNPRTPDLRKSNPLEQIGTAFMPASSTIDVRSVRIPRGKVNIPNVGIFLWRLHDFPMEEVRARKSGPVRAYTFSPLGLDAPLFNSPEPQGMDAASLGTEADVPDVLRRRAVHDDLEAMRQAKALGLRHRSPYFDTDPPVFRVQVAGEAEPIPAEEVFVCNLEAWGEVPTARTYRDAQGDLVNLPIRVGVDPLRGRLRFVQGQGAAGEVLVSYSYGFGSAIGGGPYDRTRYLADLLPDRPEWYRVVQTATPGAEPFVVSSLQQAVSDWNAEGGGKSGVIVVADSRTYASSPLTLEIAENSHLTLIAGRWPLPDLATDPRDFRQISPSGVRPHLRTNLRVQGTAPAGSEQAGSLAIDGLLIEGKLIVRPGNLKGLHLADTTLVPGASSLAFQGTGSLRLEARIDRCILGGVQVAGPIERLSIRDSIVQGAVTGGDVPLEVERCTIAGIVDVQQIEASDAIFLQPLGCERTQIGCVRFSYVPEGSRTPRRYRCQPDLAIEEAETESPAAAAARVSPSLASVVYGQPSYMLLAESCSSEILAGASNGDEMGAFNREYRTLREANLRFVLDDYLRVGLEAGIFHST
ncbi:MAG TPA: phage tail protein [Fimbriimonas sp.]